MRASQTKSAAFANQPKALQNEVWASFNEIEGANKKLRSFKTFMLVTMTNFAVNTLQEQARNMAAQRSEDAIQIYHLA